MLPISLREGQIARQMSSRIYSRALELYRKGAVENLVLRGRRLNAQVQGFHEPFYTVTIDFDEQGVRQATCTCAYDYGDWCKHIGAVLLACIRAPEKIVQMPPIEQVLEPLDAAALRRVLLELASEDPKVADRITLLAQIAQQPSREASDTPRALRVTDFARDMVDDSIESLGAVGAAIQRLIETADYAGALKLMTAETEQQLNLHWRWRIGRQEFDDFYGESFAESALNALAYLATELVLSLSDPKDPIIQQITQLAKAWLEHEIDPWGDGIIACVGALIWHGQVPHQSFKSTYDSSYSSWLKKFAASVGDGRSRRPDPELEDLMDAVNVVRLRVYEQRGDIEAYLQLAWEIEQYHRYAIMQALQGNFEAALETARQQFVNLREWDSFVRALDALGHTETAIPLAYDALRESHKRRRSNPYDPEADLRASLGEWLAARAAERGEDAIALEAMQISVEDEPTLEKYKRLEQLAGAQWAKLRPQVLRRIREHRDAEEVAAIYIYEGKHADALQILCDRHALTPALARQIVDHEPASTRSVCLEEANEIILNARSRDYPLAADWLEVVKRSYYAEGKPHEWEAFIQTLMEQHKRKTALIPLLRKLAEEG
jgi:uncharacterized Zn finger protein